VTDHHVLRFATAVILEATYGYNVKGDQDELVILARQVMHDADQTGRPGAYLVDVIPQSMLLIGRKLFRCAYSGSQWIYCHRGFLELVTDKRLPYIVADSLISGTFPSSIRVKIW
jgi:hypothetical protein